MKFSNTRQQLEAQWAEPVLLTCWTNQKQELPMAPIEDLQ